MMVLSKQTLFLLSLPILFLLFYFINHKYYKYHKFRSYIRIVSAICSFYLALGVLYQVWSFRKEENTTTLESLSSFSKDYIDSIVEMFTEHPEMNYYYDELFNGKVNNNHKRNIFLENQITMRILAKTVEQISIIDIYGEIHEINFIKTTLIKILNGFFKSNKFKHYYLYNYKPHLAGPLTISFIKENFGV